MNKCSYIDGIASSQAIDSSGEIVDLKGLDTSSLIGAVLNWEHKSDSPSQICGKILKAHKIFSKEDCQDDRQSYFWNKYKIPFLYIMGRLFDDPKNPKPSALEVASLFKDDAEHPNEPPVVGFSVEGAKIPGAKEGMTITRSIARKVTITNLPCNKTCVAELMPSPKESTNKDNLLGSLFKGEMELFKFESTYEEILQKKESERIPTSQNETNEVVKGTAMDVGAGYEPSTGGGQGGGASGGGAFIGSQLAMSEEMDKGEDDEYKRWRGAATRVGARKAAVSRKINDHIKAGGKSDAPEMADHWARYKDLHEQSKQINAMNPRKKLAKGENGDWKKEGYTLRYAKGNFNTGGQHLVQAFDNKGNHIGETELSEHHSKASGGRLHPVQTFVDHRHRRKGIASAMYNHAEEKTGLKIHPSHKQTIEGKKFSDNRKSEDLKKALTAGSAMATPSQLVGGAALGKESLEKRPKMNAMIKKEELKKDTAPTAPTPSPSPAPVTAEGVQAGFNNALGFGGSLKKKEKSHWYERADQAYSTWDKKNQFKDYMKKRMPHLAEGEIDSIGRVLALKKTVQAEGKLSKMYASYFGKAETGHEIGVHSQADQAIAYGKKGIKRVGGVSAAGADYRGADVHMARVKHKEALHELKQMPSPNLPKSENMKKSYEPDPSHAKQSGYHPTEPGTEYIHGLPKGHPSLGEHKGHTYRKLSPPTKDHNFHTWAVKTPKGQNYKVNLPAHTGGSRESIHEHINARTK